MMSGTASLAEETVQTLALKKSPFNLAIAGFTFNKFKLEETLVMMKQVDVHYLCIKDFHLKMDCTVEDVAAFHVKCAEFGVKGYGVGPIYMKDEEAVNKAFAYAKLVGVKVLVGVPHDMIEKKRVASAKLLKLINEKVQEYDIKYAIHNHGPDMPELFPNAESAIEMIGNLDKRIGLCLDIGHQFRDGKDPVAAILKYHERLHDVHIKNVTAPTKMGKGIEMPRGLIDMPAVVRALCKVNYSGACSLEYEKDMDKPLLGIAESIGYFRGVMDSART
ncbi:MAG: sugar phosphate isomerase/epimerase family protein [bacterium]